VRGIFQFDPSPSGEKSWRGKAWAMLKFCTIAFAALGFVAGCLSMLGGNTMSINGTAMEGWRGVWILTFALGVVGFLFGLIWFLVLSAIGIASSGGK
jgi:hypothetical protein